MQLTSAIPASSFEFCALLNTGIDPLIQKIEMSSTFQIPSIQIVGLPSREINESKERIRSAILLSGLDFPKRRVVLNLSPASVRKQGTGVDLALALAILSDELPEQPMQRVFAWAELGLRGELKSSGQIARVLKAATTHAVDLLILAAEDEFRVRELLPLFSKSMQLKLLFVRHLTEAFLVLKNETPIPYASAHPASVEPDTPDQRDGQGQGQEECDTFSPQLLQLPFLTQRSVMASVAGLHHLLLLGPRGVGKSYAFEWWKALCPSPENETKLNHLLIQELTQPFPEITLSPFRVVSPHARPQSLLGSVQAGAFVPGEFTRAHGGALFADEFPEWHRDSRESLREPLEGGRLTLSRVGRGLMTDHQSLPAKFVLVANGNLCPCGGIPPESKSVSLHTYPSCRCTPATRDAYWNRLSGPILDRIDLSVRLSLPITRESKTVSAAPLKRKVALARKILRETYGVLPGELSSVHLETLVARRELRLDPPTELIFESFRARHKLIRVAMTLAALDGHQSPEPHHWFEAKAYRLSTCIPQSP